MTHTDTPTSPNAALATPDLIRGSGQRAKSIVRAPPEPSAAAPEWTAADAPARRTLPRRSTGYRISGEDSIIMRKRNA